MSDEAAELHRIMLDAYRIQAAAAPVTDKALEQIVFRAAHAIVHNLSPYPSAQRAALLPNVVRLLLAAFLEPYTVRRSLPPSRPPS